MTPLQQNWIDDVRTIVLEKMAKLQAGHGTDHVLRVHVAAKRIWQSCGGDLCVIELAALLHDIGDAKFHDGHELSASMSREILAGLKVPNDTIEVVARIVDNISFRKGVDPSSLSLEGKIVQDADRLDALGAVGIVRTIEYGSFAKQPFYIPGTSQEAHATLNQKTGVGHFFDKLFRLPDLMNTQPGREMAKARINFMHHFLDQFFAEVL